MECTSYSIYVPLAFFLHDWALQRSQQRTSSLCWIHLISPLLLLAGIALFNRTESWRLWSTERTTLSDSSQPTARQRAQVGQLHGSSHFAGADQHSGPRHAASALLCRYASQRRTHHSTGGLGYPPLVEQQSHHDTESPAERRHH